MRGRLLFLTKPLFEEADDDLAYGAAIPRRFGFHLTVEVVGNLEGCLHEASLLYCWLKNKEESRLGKFGNAARHEIAAQESGGMPAHDPENPLASSVRRIFSEILKLGFQGRFSPGIHLP
jgi:hypothetical protein